MWCALRLAERGVDVALLEADFCGWGASSRNAGQLTPTIAGDPQLLATIYHSVGMNPRKTVYNHLNQPREMVNADAVMGILS